MKIFELTWRNENPGRVFPPVLEFKIMDGKKCIHRSSLIPKKIIQGTVETMVEGEVEIIQLNEE